jgi:hypothetical protein
VEMGDAVRPRRPGRARTDRVKRIDVRQPRMGLGRSAFQTRSATGGAEARCALSASSLKSRKRTVGPIAIARTARRASPIQVNRSTDESGPAVPGLTDAPQSLPSGAANTRSSAVERREAGDGESDGCGGMEQQRETRGQQLTRGLVDSGRCLRRATGTNLPPAARRCAAQGPTSNVQRPASSVPKNTKSEARFEPRSSNYVGRSRLGVSSSVSVNVEGEAIGFAHRVHDRFDPRSRRRRELGDRLERKPNGAARALGPVRHC